MSRKYKLGDRVPTDVLVARLNELSKAVSDGTAAVRREFTMRIPAELDRDADLVLSEAAKRLGEMAYEIEVLRRYGNKGCTAMADEYLASDESVEDKQAFEL